DTIDGNSVLFGFALPALKVDGAGKGSQHDELRECNTSPLGERNGCFKSLSTVTRQAEDEGSEHMDAALLECLKPLHQGFSCVVEALVDIFEPLRCTRFDAHQRAANVSTPHGIQKFRVLGGFPRDLREEDEVIGQAGQFTHQLKQLLTQSLIFIKQSV